MHRKRFVAAAESGADAVQVRPAVADDAAALATLCAEHAAFERIAYEPMGHAERLRQGLAEGRVQIWLAQGQEALLGYAAVSVDFSTISARPYLHLDCLYLREAARSQGIGQRLMQAVEAAGLQAGCREMQWQTPAWNSGAIRFYERIGARALPKQRFFRALPAVNS